MPMEHVPSHAWTHFNAGKYLKTSFKLIPFLKKLIFQPEQYEALKQDILNTPTLDQAQREKLNIVREMLIFFPKIHNHFRVSTNWCREWRLIWLWETRTTSRRICPSSGRWEDWALFWKKIENSNFQDANEICKGNDVLLTVPSRENEMS